MKGANKLFIFTGVALALVAVLIGITMSSGGNKSVAQDEDNPDKIRVVKAAVDFEPHTVLSMADVVVEEVSSDEAPADAATDVSLVLNQSYKLGAVKGDVILTSYLQPPGIRNSIEAGKRAVSLEVDNQGLMSGLVMDGDYVDIVFQGRVDLQRVYQGSGVEIVEESPPYNFKEVPIYDGNEDESQQIQGADGSEFIVHDSGMQLEPVAKLLIQDIKVLRVIPAGVMYDGRGQQVAAPAETTSAPGTIVTSQLILEVTPQQAEAIAFMQDETGSHSYEVVVRGEGDHETVTTTGLTFQILMSDGTWSLPWPKPVFAPGDEDYPGGSAPVDGDDGETPESDS
jgi:Flp pilus assembly protein CpaB